MRRVILGLLAPGLSACVYPATEPTGMELSWRFVEHNAVDGEEAIAVRSCAGAIAEQIAVDVQDQDAPARHGIFRFDCPQGYQTVDALQTEASDAFIRLDPGLYTVSMHAVDDATNALVDELVDTREVEVEERIITIASWELSRAPVTWSVDLQGTETCEQLTLALHYDTPDTDLAEYTEPDEEPSLVLYRRALASDRGLSAGGEATGCSAELGGIHVFDGLDRGVYLLEIAVDGSTCTQRVDLSSPQGATSVIDLANASCGG